MHILITSDKKKYILSESEKDNIYNAILTDQRCAILQGDMISLQIVPMVMEFNKWLSQENDELARSNKRRCRKCLNIIDAITNVCNCMKEKGIGRTQHAILPANNDQKVQELDNYLKSLSSKISFPKSTVEQEPKTLISGNENVDFYLDDNGDKMYS